MPLSKGEFRGVQNVLTQRLRRTLEAQDAARRNAYRFRAKASQHLDMQSADNWSAERALELLKAESLKMKVATTRAPNSRRSTRVACALHDMSWIHVLAAGPSGRGRSLPTLATTLAPSR